MNQFSRAQVITKDGWSKECMLKGQIAYIGSKPDSDIALTTIDGVEERHLMLRPSTSNPFGYTLVNLSRANIHRYEVGSTSNEIVAEIVKPRDSIELANGSRVSFVGHELFYWVGARTSTKFDVRLKFDNGVTLSPDRDLSGNISIKNSGDQNAAQFRVVVEGLPEHSIDAEAGPLLFSGVEKAVAFKFAHPKQANPPAGKEHPICFHVMAEDAYPGERATIVQMIEIAPYSSHSLKTIDFAPGIFEDENTNQ